MIAMFDVSHKTRFRDIIKIKMGLVGNININMMGEYNGTQNGCNFNSI